MDTYHLRPFRSTLLYDQLMVIDTKHELRIEDDSCFWVGAVSIENLQGLKKFLKLLEQQNIGELCKYSQMGRATVYAVLVRDLQSATKYHLFALRASDDPDENSRFVFGAKIDKDMLVNPLGKE